RGTTDPEVLAELARGKLRAKLPALRQALRGRFRPHHAFLVSQLLAHLDYVDETITTLSERIEEVIGPFADELARLDTIHGVARRTAEVLIAELGVDMSQFPSDRHLASEGPCRVRAGAVGADAGARSSDHDKRAWRVRGKSRVQERGARGDRRSES